MAVLNLRGVPDELAKRLKSEAALGGISLRDHCIGILSREAYPLYEVDAQGGGPKKIAEVSAGAVAQDGGSPSEALPRGGKAALPKELNDLVENASLENLEAAHEEYLYGRSGDNSSFGAVVIPRQAYEFPQWSPEQMKKMTESEPGGLIACSPELLAEMKEGAKTDGGVAATLHLAGVELDREILVHWGLVDNYKPKMEEINGGIENGGAAGKDRRNPDAVQENNNGGESGAMGVGKPQVNMDLLRAIAAGNIPKDALEAVDYLSKEIEVDLCGFKSYNDVDGENYICGKEKHGPKIKHGEWVKI